MAAPVTRLNRKPPGARFRQQPVVTPLYRLHSKKEEIDAILAEHDYGNLQRSAGLLDEVLTDDRISAVAETRAGALLAAPLQFRASLSKRKAEKLSELMGGTEDDVGLWPRIAPPEAQQEIIICGRFLGIAIAEIVWRYDGGMQVPRLVPIHLQTCRYDHVLRRLVIYGMDGRQVVLPDPSEEPRSDGQWFIYTPYGYHRGWRRAMLRSLADHYIKRRWNYRDWARYCEKHGLAIIEGQVPAGATQDEVDDFVEDLGNIGSEAAVLSPQGSNGEASFGIKLIEPTAQTWQSFQAFKKEIDTDIAIRVLGQNLTTDNTAGPGGSRALGDVQNLVRLDKLAEDAKIATTIRDQVLTWWAEFNFGDPELAPVPEYLTGPPEDEKAEADTLESIGRAVKALQDAGIPVDGEAIAEKHGIPLLALEDREVDEAPEPPSDGSGEGAGEPGGRDPSSGGDSGASSDTAGAEE